MDFKVGDMVVFIDDKANKADPEFYPPVGTCGKVLGFNESLKLFCVEWRYGSGPVTCRGWYNTDSIRRENN